MAHITNLGFLGSSDIKANKPESPSVHKMHVVDPEDNRDSVFHLQQLAHLD